MTKTTMTTNGFLTLPDGTIEYIKHGEGKPLLICLHGFGDSAKLFSVLAPTLQKRYTVYAISLPFHGKSTWKKKQFTLNTLIEVIELIKQKEKQERLSIMGYSLGGRSALMLVPHYYKLLDHLYLCAADGIKTHRLYDFAQLPHWFSVIVPIVMRSHKLMFWLVGLAYRKQWISKFLYDFTYNHFNTKEQRRRFFGCTTFVKSSRNMNLEQVQAYLNKEKVPVDLYFGKRDEVILMEGAQEFEKAVDGATLYTLDKGHLLIDEDLMLLLEKQLNTKVKREH
ncbi:alpha/beta hydrolase [Algivirga pacifica]|uniref:AB hydrolase-1 domain-containing protein n=1 Tax=Algivirga pacifica TaxID=1162670 RepID=A0ABP9D962_9BACT